MIARAFCTSAGLMVLVPALAAAQPARPTSSGPMTIERLNNGLFAQADGKITKIDGRTSELVGGQAGWMTDETLFIGGGGYWLANGSRDRELAYGGFVVQWLVRGRERVGFGARTLVGGGEATLSRTITVTPPRLDPRDLRDTRGNNLFAPIPRSLNVRSREAIFVAEPEANVFVRLNDHLRVLGGVGYRFVGADRDDGRLRGATGTVSLQLF